MSEIDKQPNLSFSEIFNNYLIVSDFTHTVSKLRSKTRLESHIKFKCTEIVERKSNMFSWGFQGLCLLGLVKYCLKSRSYLKKIGFTLTYLSLVNHFFHIGSHLGVLLSLKTIIKEYNIGDSYDIGRYTNQFIIGIRDNNIKDKSMLLSKILNNNQDIDLKNDIKIDKYLKNNYFSINREKYFKNNDNENITNKKIPFLKDEYNYFLFKYMYFSFYKFIKRVKVFIGILKEEEFD